MKVTYSKLNSGDWGVRVVLDEPFEEFPEPGTEVTVTKKSGETSQRTVANKVWEGEDAESKQPVALYGLQ